MTSSGIKRFVKKAWSALVTKSNSEESARNAFDSMVFASMNAREFANQVELIQGTSVKKPEPKATT